MNRQNPLLAIPASLRSPIRAGAVCLALLSLVAGLGGVVALDATAPVVPLADQKADLLPTERLPAVAPVVPALPATTADPTESEGLSFGTGALLTDAQADEFRTHIAALKATGQHRGHAFW